MHLSTINTCQDIIHQGMPLTFSAWIGRCCWKDVVLIRNRCSQIWRRNYEKTPLCWLENIRNTHGFLKKLSVRPTHWLLRHLGVHETSWMWNRFKHEELRLKSPGSCSSWSRDRPQNPIGWPASYLGHSRCVDSTRNMRSMNVMNKCPSHWFLYPADCTGTSELSLMVHELNSVQKSKAATMCCNWSLSFVRGSHHFIHLY